MNEGTIGEIVAAQQQLKELSRAGSISDDIATTIDETNLAWLTALQIIGNGTTASVLLSALQGLQALFSDWEVSEADAVDIGAANDDWLAALELIKNPV